jgi:hypothetical protein
MDCCYSSSRIILQVRMTMLVPRGQEINDRHSINYFFHPPSSFIPTSTNSHSTPQCLLGTPLNRGPLPGKERPKLTLVLTAIRRSAKPAPTPIQILGPPLLQRELARTVPQGLRVPDLLPPLVTRTRDVQDPPTRRAELQMQLQTTHLQRPPQQRRGRVIVGVFAQRRFLPMRRQHRCV